MSPQKVKVHVGYNNVQVETESELCVLLSVGSGPQLQAVCIVYELKARHLVGSPPVRPSSSKAMCCARP